MGAHYRVSRSTIWWRSPTQLLPPEPGPGNWVRVDDLFVAADVDGDGREEILIADNGSGWTGLLKLWTEMDSRV
jgi:hypothetical protein